MNIETISGALRSLLRREHVDAMLLNGEWGAGKTYFVKKFAQENSGLLTELGLRFAYVSLFGITSIDEVRNRLALPARGALLTDALPEIAGFDLSKLGSLAKAYIQDRRLKQMFVCFDDLERMGDGLRLDDVLGLVSELTEERQCKCVVLTNAGELDDSEKPVLRYYAEKVFDLEIAFNPTPADVISIGIPDKESAAYALPIFQKARCSNIRVMQRTNWVLNEVRELHIDLPEGVWPLIVKQAAILCIVYYRYRHVFGGTLSQLQTWSKFGYLAEKAIEEHEEKAVPTPNEGKELLITLGYDVEPFDLAIIALLETGNLPLDAMEVGVKEAHLRAAKSAAEREYSAIWDAYRGSFQLSSEDFHRRLFTFLDKNSAVVSPAERLSSCDLLLKLKLTPEAKKLVEKVLRPIVKTIPPQHRRERLKEFPHVVNACLLEDLDFEPDERCHSIESLFLSLTEHGGLNPSGFDTFSQFSSSEIYELLKQYQRPDEDGLLPRIHEFYSNLQFIRDDAKRNALRGKMNEALDRLAAEDPLHRIRIDAFIEQRFRQKEPSISEP